MNNNSCEVKQAMHPVGQLNRKDCRHPGTLTDSSSGYYWFNPSSSYLLAAVVNKLATHSMDNDAAVGYWWRVDRRAVRTMNFNWGEWKETIFKLLINGRSSDYLNFEPTRGKKPNLIITNSPRPLCSAHSLTLS